MTIAPAAMSEDPDRSPVTAFRAVVEVLRAIRDDPSAAQVRREQWERLGPAWAVPVRGRDEDWLVVWRAADDGVVEVLYLRPDVVV